MFLRRRDEASTLRRVLWRRALMQNDLCRAGMLVALASRRSRSAAQDAAITFAVDCTIIGLPEPRAAAIDVLLNRRWTAGAIERLVRSELALVSATPTASHQRPARHRALAAPRDPALVLDAAHEAFWASDFEDAATWATAGLRLPDSPRSPIHTAALRRVLAHAERRLTEEASR